MPNKKTVPIHVTGVSEATHAAVKQAAAKRRISINNLWLKIIYSGCKRLKIEIEV